MRCLLLLILLIGAGCATTDPSVIGSKPWYEQRMTEIETANERGELTPEEYLRLKNEADAIRADYRGNQYPGSGVSVGVGFISHD
jgi:hypothetical protein